MSYDGWPPNLQSFCSKICLWSPKSWTPFQKTHFSLNSPSEFGGRAFKIGGRIDLVRWPNYAGSVAEKCRSKSVKISSKFGGRTVNIGGRILTSSNFKFSSFVAFSSMNHNE